MARDLLDETSSEDEGSGSSQEGSVLRVNQDFAKKFEHNKKREELQKLEEKHGSVSKKRKRADADADSGASGDSSSDPEDDDDVGELATIALDSEILATLNAIKSGDPRVYDGKTTFYTTNDDVTPNEKEKVDKPLYLRDYHRQNLLNGQEADNNDRPMTYNQEQEQLKKSIVDQMHAAADDSGDEEDGLLVAKQRQRPIQPQVALDVGNADKDPEKFLSNFMAARAWVPNERSTWQPFESDDEEEDLRAEKYEEAYNMRFEDPNKSNETLRTHARDMAARYSVRRDETNARKKKRDAEKERKELEKEERKEEKARLRRLRIEQVEDKVQKIKRAAGLRTGDLRPEDWSRFVDDDWDDGKWEEEMQKRFGEDYYAGDDVMSDEAGEENQLVTKKKVKKPKFDDDIDINDIVPDFKEEEEAEFSLSDDQKATKKNHKKIKAEKKRDSKKERRIIEQLVDDQLQLELDNALPGKSTGFRYRDTSPQSFGMNAIDILMAEDTQLNQFAGLKKLAAFRDPEKKRKDKKHLGKKARLRQWRKEVFGDEDGPGTREPALDELEKIQDDQEDTTGGVNIRTQGKKKRRRSKKQKSAVEAKS